MDQQQHVGDRHSRPDPGPERCAMKRTIWLLFCCQALMSAVSLGHAATGALIAHSLATNKALATLPAGMNMAAAMAASAVAAAMFERFGRRAGFLLGAAASSAGCLGFAAAVLRGDFALQCLGAVPAGLGFGIAQHLQSTTKAKPFCASHSRSRAPGSTFSGSRRAVADRSPRCIASEARRRAHHTRILL